MLVIVVAIIKVQQTVTKGRGWVQRLALASPPAAQASPPPAKVSSPPRAHTAPAQPPPQQQLGQLYVPQVIRSYQKEDSDIVNKWHAANTKERSKDKAKDKSKDISDSSATR